MGLDVASSGTAACVTGVAIIEIMSFKQEAARRTVGVEPQGSGGGKEVQGDCGVLPRASCASLARRPRCDSL